jgi:hypothetical protein
MMMLTEGSWSGPVISIAQRPGLFAGCGRFFNEDQLALAFDVAVLDVRLIEEIVVADHDRSAIQCSGWPSISLSLGVVGVLEPVRRIVPSADAPDVETVAPVKLDDLGDAANLVGAL